MQGAWRTDVRERPKTWLRVDPRPQGWLAPLAASLGSVQFGGELGAKAQDGLRVQLRDAGLGHAENLTDLA
jgi:hypothetical protein